MAPTGAVVAFQEYKDLMHSILTKSTTQEEIQQVKFWCPGADPYPQSSPFDRSFLSFLAAVFLWPRTLWKQQQLSPLHPTANLIQEQILALPPFKNMPPEILLKAAVGITIPSWLTGTAEACHISAAVERTFGRLLRIESPSSSAYTAAGYELCRISYEAFECTGPGRIMTLEYDGNLAVASMMQTPLTSWFANPVIFSARAGLTSQSMTEWINSFIDSQKPEKLMLVGANADDALFMNAVANSRAVLESSPLLPGQILAFGAAQAAKERLESQVDDCGEPEECMELRRKADAIAGTYKPLNPSLWPANRLNHVEL